MNFCSSSLCLIIFQFILSYIHKFSHPDHFFHIWSINKSYKFYFLSIPLQQSPNCMLNLLLCAVYSVIFNFLRPHGLQPTRLLYPQNFSGKNTGMGCHFLLLQGIFLTQGSSHISFISCIAGGLFTAEPLGKPPR